MSQHDHPSERWKLMIEEVDQIKMQSENLLGSPNYEKHLLNEPLYKVFDGMYVLRHQKLTSISQNHEIYRP